MVQTLLLTTLFFAGCVLLLSIGFLIRGAVLKGSCGGAAAQLGDDASCGACAKKEKEICPTDDETGFVRMSQISNPHRTLKDRPEGPSFTV